ncbi:DUF3274 domain-containing protein [Buttiauxella sp. S04-F03]|uniref:T6SS effector phospholipase Tle3 domain-containing protein n=1 Tax=Buttiauxella sp. W03-F01 TaxID=2904524 RepID=UPI001E4423A2|nr:DUF3274 domain-containing protein [Buttiauxella sp. W03-F01]MCE0799402.1 DUF3274 domain-containing protein [Buttiauxella sp. W03-F01]
MTETKNSPFAPRVVSQGDIPVHKDLGEVAQTCRVGVPRPMPCIVILIHGVNDVGEAYQNQEKGIIAGLSKRLGRNDFHAHGWRDFIMMHNEEAQKKVSESGRSPVIPFYWGYKPVTHADYRADQQRYREEIDKVSDAAHLPYDAYQEDNEKNKAALGNDGSSPFKYQNDNFKNALDANFAKNGGTFANATTNIPDMLGPGAGGVALAVAGFGTLHMNGGDYTHPIFPNPHRIYQFFAAQRLADLIIQIRGEDVTKNDVINVVAHSQGTIITMLANMLVKQAGYDPVNCTILNHSPYSLEARLSEDAQPGHHQTAFARQKTFKNFCALMATQYKGGELSDGAMLEMEASCTLRKPSDNPLRKDMKYRRDNNGKVYNYFCPQDGTVSLQNIQGFGWRGIPNDIAKNMPNLRQRVFCQHRWVGRLETEPFKMSPKNKGDFSTTPVMNAGYSYSDVVINGEELPEPFIFELQGERNKKDDDPATWDTPYEAYIDPDSPDAYISYSAKAYAVKRTDSATYSVSHYQSLNWRPGHVLTPEELKVESVGRKHEVIRGVVTGTKDFQNVTLTWLKTPEELQAEWQKTDPVGYSQHSSIVMSELAPSHAMAFDLALGQCKAFDYKAGKFWEDLLHRADWRDPLNGNSATKEYYRSGKLPQAQTKNHMNRPDEVLPKGDFGVENQFNNPTTIQPSRDLSAGNQETPNLQWAMPKPMSDSQLA